MEHSSSERIAAELRAWIATASAGAQLPSTRSLVAAHGVSPVTVQQALRTLVREGLVESRPGAGTFVRMTRKPRARDYAWQTGALGAAPRTNTQLVASLRQAPNSVVALHSGYPALELLPERLIRTAFARAARSASVVSRPPSAGLEALQAWFAAELAANTTSDVTPPSASNVVVLPGSQSGLSTLFRTLVGAGQPLIVESPTYWGAILAAAQVGVELVPVPSGPNGPDPDEVERAFARTGARAIYAQPNFANPSGGQWPIEVGDRVLSIVREHGAFLIEDDWAKDFGMSTESVPLAAKDDTGHVVYIRSLSKSVSPAVRVAGLIARGPAYDRILADTQAQSMYVSDALQSVALDVVSQPGWRTHLRELRRQLTARRDLLLDAIDRHLPEATVEAVPRGGLHVWLRLPDDTDLPSLSREAEARGVLIAPGDPWFPAEPTGKFLRLNFSGPHPDAFDDAMRAVGDCLRG